MARQLREGERDGGCVDASSRIEGAPSYLLPLTLLTLTLLTLILTLTLLTLILTLTLLTLILTITLLTLILTLTLPTLMLTLTIKVTLTLTLTRHAFLPRTGDTQPSATDGEHALLPRLRRVGTRGDVLRARMP